MNTGHLIEIVGTLNAPYLPSLPEGAPRCSVSVTARVGETQRTFALHSAQCSGSPIPFRMMLDRQSLADVPEFILEARCTVGPLQDDVLARHVQSLTIDDLAQMDALDLNLEAVDPTSEPAGKHPVAPQVIPLGGNVTIPAALRQPQAFLDVTLLLIQDDGYSNRYSSNIAEHSLLVTGDGAPFTLCIDSATVPDGQSVKLHIGLYDLERKRIFAGHVFKNLDLSNPPDLSEIVLKAPRH